MSTTAVGPETGIRGIEFSRMQPGGLAGPNGEVHAEVLGGQVWMDLWAVGKDTDEFKMAIPDIRMPANQIWPLHWHNEWIAVVVLDGKACVGDTWMGRGGVLVSREDLEYGPVVVGPRGCQLIEVFARNRFGDRKSTRLNSSHIQKSRMPSSA